MYLPGRGSGSTRHAQVMTGEHGDRHFTGSAGSAGRGRIALLFATSGHSGVDRVVANLVAEFAHSEHDFDLLTIRKHGPRIDALPPNIRHVPLRAAHRDTALLPLILYMRRERPRALLTAGHRLNRCALLARRLSGASVHITLRMGMSLAGMQDRLGHRRAARLIRSMRAWYPHAEALVTPSHGVAGALLEHGIIRAEQLHVIPNPIVNEHLRALSRERVDHPWFRTGEPPVVLGAGALIRRKDFPTLIRAFARLRNRRQARLVILGEGPERARLERLIGELDVVDSCSLPGHVDNPYSYMAGARVFALSSRAEGSGAVLVEALACGTPTAATDCPSGPAETLGQGRYGRLVPVGDDGALADALDELLTHPTPESERARAIAPFLASASAARYLAALGAGGGRT